MLLTEEEWNARMKRQTGRTPQAAAGIKKKKKNFDPYACRKCGKIGH